MLNFFYAKKIPLFISILIFINGFVIILAGFYPFIDNYITDFHPEKKLHFLFYSYNEKTTIGYQSIFYFFLGYFLLTVGRGIYRRRRSAWFFSITILIVVVIINIFGFQHYKFLFYVHIIEVILLLAYYPIFNEKDDKFRLSYAHIMIFVSFVLSLCYGVFGSYFLKKDFANLETFSDAIYFTIITYSTIGYGDIYAKTENARVFVTSMTFFGLASFAILLSYAITSLGNQVQKLVTTFNKGKNYMKDHVIIFGINPLSKLIIQNFNEKNVSYVILDNKDDDDVDIKEHYIRGEFNDFYILDKAHLSDSSILYIGFDTDAENILALLSIKEYFEDKPSKIPKIMILINQKINEKKANKLGADDIISPYDLAVKQIMSGFMKIEE